MPCFQAAIYFPSTKLLGQLLMLQCIQAHTVTYTTCLRTCESLNRTFGVLIQGVVAMAGMSVLSADVAGQFLDLIHGTFEGESALQGERGSKHDPNQARRQHHASSVIASEHLLACESIITAYPCSPCLRSLTHTPPFTAQTHQRLRHLWARWHSTSSASQDLI